jgi:hypothetical protein
MTGFCLNVLGLIYPVDSFNTQFFVDQQFAVKSTQIAVVSYENSYVELLHADALVFFAYFTSIFQRVYRRMYNKFIMQKLVF